MSDFANDDVRIDYVIENLSGSNSQHTDHDGIPLTLHAGSYSEGMPLMRLGIRGPINLRGRPADDAYKITLG
jgi:hypothetical protein